MQQLQPHVDAPATKGFQLHLQPPATTIQATKTPFANQKLALSTSLGLLRSNLLTHYSALTVANSDIYSFANNNPTDLVEDTAMLVDSILQLYQPSTMKTTMEWKLRMGSMEDLKAKLSKCKKHQKQFAQKVNLQQGNSGAQRNFLALYEQAFGTIPGT